jgi:hypothetical protein
MTHRSGQLALGLSGAIGVELFTREISGSYGENQIPLVIQNASLQSVIVRTTLRRVQDLRNPEV